MEQHEHERRRPSAAGSTGSSRPAPHAARSAADEALLPQWEDDLTEESILKVFAAARAPANIQEALHSMPDRTDLERLFERKVTIAQIVQLLGRNVNRRDVQRLIESADVQAEIRLFLAATPDSHS